MPAAASVDRRASSSGQRRAVVVRLRFGGYGIVRSLHRAGIPMVAFEHDMACPEARTRLCDVRRYTDEEDLLEQLLELGDVNDSPVLYLSRDEAVEFVVRNRSALEEQFAIDLPDSETVSMLLHKDSFHRFATEHDFRVPHTLVGRAPNELLAAVDDFPMPCVLKPFKHTARWTSTGSPKAIRFDDRTALADAIRRISPVEPNLVLQQWIPGDDSTIYFCLTYYDGTSKCLGTFIGRKLRQWPPRTGSTSAAVPANAPAVESETLRLFDLVGYRGFGSVEFKRHEDTGDFYIMEPTVGRVNQQSMISWVNGVDLPVLAYRSLLGLPTGPTAISPSRSIAYRDEEAELFNIARDIAGGRIPRLRAEGARGAYRYFDREDMRPAISLGRRLVRTAGAAAKRRLLRD